MHFRQWKRREFITLLGTAAAWPLAGRAQQGERTRRIGVVMVTKETDPETPLRAMAFRQALAKLGLSEGRNVVIDFRFGTGDLNQFRAQAKRHPRCRCGGEHAGGGGVAPGDSRRADRILAGGKSDRQRSRRELGTSRCERYRIH